MVSRPAVCKSYSIPLCVFLLVMRKGCHAFPMVCQSMRQSSSCLRTQDTRMRAAEEDGTTTDTSVMTMAKYTLERVAAAILLVPPNVFSISPPMLEPNPPQSKEEQLHRQAISDALSKGYNWRRNHEKEESGLKGGFVELPESERLLFEDTPRSVDDDSEEESINPSTYGEITELGARQLCWYMTLLRNNNDVEETITNPSSNVQFYDLGSGAGKLILQAYMELPCLKRAVGIELAPSRHELAIQAYNTLQQDTKATSRSSRNSQTQSILDHARATIPNSYRNSNENGTNEPQDAVVEFQQGDIFESKDIHKATHIYVASLCFPSETMQRLAEILIRAKARSCLKCVATLQPSEVLQETFGPPRMEFVEMTWTKPTGQGCPVYFYDNAP